MISKLNSKLQYQIKIGKLSIHSLCEIFLLSYTQQPSPHSHTHQVHTVPPHTPPHRSAPPQSSPSLHWQEQGDHKTWSQLYYSQYYNSRETRHSTHLQRKESFKYSIYINSPQTLLKMNGSNSLSMYLSTVLVTLTLYWQLTQQQQQFSNMLELLLKCQNPKL